MQTCEYDAQRWNCTGMGLWDLAIGNSSPNFKIQIVPCHLFHSKSLNDWLISINIYTYIYIYPLIDRKKILYIRRSVLAFWAFWILQKWHINLLHCPIQTKGGLQCWPSLLSRCMITSLQNFHMVTNILVISQVKVLLANAAKAGNNKH